MLTTYITATQQQLQNPSSAAAKLFTTTDLTTYINLARSQIAGMAECIRNYATLTLVPNQRSYNFSAVVLGAPSTGIQDIFNIRQALVRLGSGAIWLHPRPFEWFTLYALNNVVPPTGITVRWSQYGQGVGGSIYVDPIPDQAYVLNLDTVCQPVNLVDDSTAEAIPYPWTDVVPFYAAWYALTSAQRQADADKMMERVNMYMSHARGISNPDLLPNAWSQPPSDPTLQNRIGAVKPTRAGAGG